MMNYIKIARPDHWIKQLFIVPGMVFAVVLIHLPITPAMVPLFLLTFLSTSCIASANYVINEWLDAKFDKFHPVKKKRPVVANDMRFSIVMAEYIILAAVDWRYPSVFPDIFLLWKRSSCSWEFFIM